MAVSVALQRGLFNITSETTTTLIDKLDDNPETFNLLTLRSFGESFYHHIADSALEFGYVGV